MNIFVMTARTAHNAVRPAQADHKSKSVVPVSEIASRFKESFRQGFFGVRCIVHTPYTAEPNILLPLQRLVRPFGEHTVLPDAMLGDGFAICRADIREFAVGNTHDLISGCKSIRNDA